MAQHMVEGEMHKLYLPIHYAPQNQNLAIQLKIWSTIYKDYPSASLVQIGVEKLSQHPTSKTNIENIIADLNMP